VAFYSFKHQITRKESSHSPKASTSVTHILSGTKIDLSRADFVRPVSTIYVGTILGGVKVIVPGGVHVKTSGIGIMSGLKGMRSQAVKAGGQDAPLVMINGLTILGRVKVVVNDDVPPVRIVAHQY
jgi:predicted membrane protein